MTIENTEVEIENVTTNVDNAKKEPYQLSSIISPIFGLNHQKITTIPINIKKADSSSSTIEQYVDKKTKENIFREKEVAYNNSSNLDNTRIAQIKKNREQQQIYDSLPSRYLEFRDKIFKETTSINYNNASNNNDTVITTIDLLVDDILDENK
ncbi:MULTISPECIES: hypothetical protein [unclassified Spiroplasma]|uniref:hypothetical protein n=2 Tax=Spiroplasma TaxID=2132 RepID=UPI0027A5CF24|nr:MAG: hypothetical protein PPFGHCPK_00464 [Spiroplasma endosymbiont of Drosophila atripex]